MVFHPRPWHSLPLAPVIPSSLPGQLQQTAITLILPGTTLPYSPTPHPPGGRSHPTPNIMSHA